jgi:hypothetical protein
MTILSEVRIRNVSALLLEKAPPLVVSLAVAEAYFHFGSFTRECVAFLTLWYVLDAAYARVIRLCRK